MNHKRGRSKDQRAGCLMCKPHKSNGQKDSAASKTIQEGKITQRDRYPTEE